MGRCRKDTGRFDIRCDVIFHRVWSTSGYRLSLYTRGLTSVNRPPTLHTQHAGDVYNAPINHTGDKRSRGFATGDAGEERHTRRQTGRRTERTTRHQENKGTEAERHRERWKSAENVDPRNCNFSAANRPFLVSRIAIFTAFELQRQLGTATTPIRRQFHGRNANETLSKSSSSICT
jgi:hypothetical protein